MILRIARFAIVLVLLGTVAPLWAGMDPAARFERIAAAVEAIDPPDPVAGPQDGEPPKVAVAGRLLLPWGRNDEGHAVILSLRNDSKVGPRAFKAYFFNPAGEVVGMSDKLPLPPRGSASFPVDEILAEGGWLRGSIEIVYTGPGPGRLYGSATQIDLDPVPQSETQSLVQAGFHVKKDPDGAGR